MPVRPRIFRRHDSAAWRQHRALHIIDKGWPMDTFTPAERSALMRRIGGKNTGPELAVRSIFHRLGYRFRLHRRDLPGRPDIVLPKHHKAILVHGCFWHGHTCRLAAKPKSNESYWLPKIAGNRARDARNLEALTSLGWTVLELWECAIRQREGLGLHARRDFLVLTKRNQGVCISPKSSASTYHQHRQR